MNKKVQKGLVSAVAAVMGTGIVAPVYAAAAEQGLDAQYKAAYDATSAAVASKSQKDLTAARVLVDGLYNTVKGTPNEFLATTLSSLLDPAQQVKLVELFAAIDKADASVKQADINASRDLILEMPQVWKTTFSSRIDDVQQKMIAKVNTAVEKAVASGLEADKTAAQALVAEIKTVTNNSGVAEWATAIQTKVDAVVTQLKVETVVASGAKTLKVTFNKAVTTENVAIQVKKGSVVLNGTVKFADDKKSATIELPSKLVEADYVVTVSGLTGGAVTKTVKATAEEISKIEILSDKALLNGGNVSVNVKIQNQYGEDVTNNYDQDDLTISTNVVEDSITLEDGKLTITTDPEVEGAAVEEEDKVVVTLLDPDTGVTVTKSLLASEETSVATTELVKIYQEDGEVLRTDSDATEYYLIFEAKDQYGNVVTNQADLRNDITVVLRDGDTNLEVGAITYGDINDDDKDEAYIRLGGASLEAGTATVTLLSKSTGKTTRISVKVEESTQVDTISIEAPELVVAGEDTELTYEAYDQEGNKVTDFDLLSEVEVSAQLRWEENYKDGSAKLIFNPGNDEDDVEIVESGSTVVSATTPSGEFESLKVSYEDKAIPAVVNGIDEDVVKDVAEGSSVTIELGDVLVLDQYGREIDGTEIIVTDEDEVETELNESDDLVIAALSEAGKATYTLSIENQENSEFELVVNTVEKADIVKYELATIGTIYDDGNAETHATDLVVYGYTASGVKVEVPTDWYTVQTSNDLLEYELDGQLDALNNIVTADDEDSKVSVTVTVVVDAEKAPVTLSQVVTVSDETPKANTIALEDVEDSNEDVVLDVDGDVAFLDLQYLQDVDSVDANTDGDYLDAGDINDEDDDTINELNAALQAMLTAEDQYGVDYTANAKLTFTTIVNEDEVTAENISIEGTNGATGASLSGLEAGDTFVVNFNLSGKTTSIKVVVVDTTDN